MCCLEKALIICDPTIVLAVYGLEKALNICDPNVSELYVCDPAKDSKGEPTGGIKTKGKCFWGDVWNMDREATVC